MRSTAVRLLLGLAALVLIGWGVGELWTSIAGSGERDLMRSIAQHRTDAAIGAARFVTWAGSALVLAPLAAGCAALLVRAGLPREALAIVLGLGGAIVIANAVKLLVGRPRPPVEHLQSVSGTSFPSGHATQASAFWLALALALAAATRSRRILHLALGLALVLVLAVAWSRVYLGVHYPSDVIAGMLLGTGWAAFVSHVQRAAG